MPSHSSRRPKKSLGQNFLVDGNLQRKIVECLAPEPTDEILEIGPGRGALTHHILGLPRAYYLVELDTELASAWSHETEGMPGVRVLNRDILDVELETVTPAVEDLKVVGNIPYNITTPILFHLLARPRPREILLMVQREVADRILASPGTSEFGALSVGVRSVAEVEKVLKVPRTAFRPVPAVDSTVIRIRPHRPPRLTEPEEGDLRILTRAAFQWRRKQLGTILRGHQDFGLDAATVTRAGEETGIDPRRRPETLSVGEFLRLSRFLGTV